MSDLKSGVAIGIDSGGSKTLAILVDVNGRELARNQTGGGNPWDVGVDAARQAIADAIEPLLDGSSVRAVCLGNAGVDRDADRIEVEVTLRSILPENIAIMVRNDAAAALGIVGPKRPAMVVIAGTGSIAYGEGADGTVTRVGGHGALVGDPGSGSALGLGAVRHTANVLDGCDTRGKLADLVVASLKLKRASDIVLRIQHPEFDVPLVASLAPLVAQAHLAGDRAAISLVEAEANALAVHVKRVANVIRREAALPVVLVGNIFGAFSVIRERVTAALRQTGAIAIHETSECVNGAAKLALELAGK